MTTPCIITEYIYPPIPIRSWDWEAIRAGDPQGYGPTEAAAIADLLDQEEALPPTLRPALY